MSISYQVCTGLLDSWRSILFEDIFKFNQIAGTGVIASDCGVYNQPDREQINNALETAWWMLAEELGFFLKPTYVTGEQIRIGRGVPWQLQQFKTRWGYLQALGSRATTLIEASAPVVYSDTDGDGVNDTATITIASTTVSADEIQVFFRVADGAPSAAAECWQIQPLRVTKSGNVATITGHRALFVKPTAVWNIPYQSNGQRYAGSTTTVADFVTAVDVYRVYTDSADAVTLLDDNFLRCCDTDWDVWNENTGVGLITESTLGIFKARHDFADATTCRRRPEWLEVNYLAGKPLQNGHMDRALETALVRLANTFLPYEMCNWCDMARQWWKDDNALSKEGSPFGMRMGQVEVFNTIVKKIIAIGGGVV